MGLGKYVREHPIYTAGIITISVSLGVNADALRRHYTAEWPAVPPLVQQASELEKLTAPFTVSNQTLDETIAQYTRRATAHAQLDSLTRSPEYNAQAIPYISKYETAADHTAPISREIQIGYILGILGAMPVSNAIGDALKRRKRSKRELSLRTS